MPDPDVRPELDWLEEQGPSLVLLRALELDGRAEEAQRVAQALIHRETALAYGSGLSRRDRAERHLRLAYCHDAAGSRRNARITLDRLLDELQSAQGQRADDFADLVALAVLGCILLNDCKRLAIVLAMQDVGEQPSMFLGEAWLSGSQADLEKAGATLRGHIETIGVTLLSDTWHLVLEARIAARLASARRRNLA